MLFQTNRLLSEFSTFGIGGPIRYFAEVKTADDMYQGISFAKKQSLPFLILGKGSNCLFSDSGYIGVALLNKIDFCEWKGLTVHVGAGYSFSYLGMQSAKLGLSGLEFASGIPASVGGAIFMNAGANGKDTSSALISVDYMYKSGHIQTFKKNQLNFSYRQSDFQKMDGAIISATFGFTEESIARQTQLNIINYRKNTQPLKEKSIGCIFQNPKGESAGRLIQESDLKGMKIGDAKVSEIHANFIVNSGHATANDVLQLMNEIQLKVRNKTGIELKAEVRVIPYE